jgi:2-keto-4-pentenoate hydratase/2-oxohepta-3-ene-1,7-dioic acid hydratase in catechol pathway
MRFAMFEQNGRAGIAVNAGDGLHGLWSDHPEYPGDLDSLLARGADLQEVGRRLLAAPVVRLSSPALLPPLGRPGKIVCVGLNYTAHSAETGYEVPAYPTLFARFASTLIGHEAPLVIPAVSDQLDYEGELVAVIGKGGKAIPKDKALDHVAGYSIFNDASIRDYQFRTPQWTVGKNFDGTGPFGPYLVTPDELPPGCRGLRLQTRLNGQVMQEAATDDMMFDVASLISILSEAMTLSPGDMIVTGTPSGVGFARKPPVFMKEGDVCEIEIEGVGVLRNTVEKQRG